MTRGGRNDKGREDMKREGKQKIISTQQLQSRTCLYMPTYWRSQGRN